MKDSEIGLKEEREEVLLKPANPTEPEDASKDGSVALSASSSAQDKGDADSEPALSPSALPLEHAAAALSEDFKILSLIGTGGMSVVYKVEEISTGKFYVAKVLKAALLKDETARTRFKQEAELVQKLDQPNIIKVHNFSFANDGTPFLIMDWLEGETLADYIKSRGPMLVNEAIPIFEQLTKALTYAHSKGIVHRDIKPSNILLVKTENNFCVKVMDFGIAKVLESDCMGAAGVQTETGKLLGSPAYMSPEQCLEERVDARSDIYSLGCVMYETLTAKSPFIAGTPIGTIIKHLETEAESLQADEFAHLKIPDYLESVIFKCLCKKKELRYQTAYNLQQSLFLPPRLLPRIFSPLLDLGAVAIMQIALWLVLKGLAYSYPMPPWQTFMQQVDEMLTLNQTVWIQCFWLMYVMYCVVFETSKLHGTPGQLRCGLRVSNASGGRPSVFSSMFMACTVCGAAMWIFFGLPLFSFALALDSASGSSFMLIYNTWGWSLLFFGLYALYVGLFVLSKKQQWYLDSLFDRRIQSISEFKACMRLENSAKWPSYQAIIVASLGLGLVIGMPELFKYLLDRDWADPSVGKVFSMSAINPIKKGSVIRNDDLRSEVILGDAGGDIRGAIYDPKELVGLTAARELPSEVPLYRNDFVAAHNSAWNLVNLGSSSELRGDREAALNYYHKAVRANPHEATAWDGLARVYSAFEQTKEAELAGKKAAACRKLDKASAALRADEIAENLCSARADQNARYACLALTKHALLTNPNDTRLLSARATALDGLSATIAAAETWKRVLSLDPHNELAMTKLAKFLLSKQEWSEAKVLAQRAVKANASNASAWSSLGVALSRLKDNDGAQTALERALKLDPNSTAIQDELAALMHAVGQGDDPPESSSNSDSGKEGPPAK